MATNVDHLIEVSGVYDGWSIAVVRYPEYAYANRWADRDDVNKPAIGYERHYEATEEYIARSGVARMSISKVVWK